MKDEEINEFVGREAIAKHLKSLLQSTEGKLPTEPTDEIIRFDILKPLREGIQAWIAFLPVVNLVVECPLPLGDVEFVGQEVAHKESGDVIRAHRFGGSDEEQAGQRDDMLKVIDNFGEQSRGYAKVTFRAHQGNVSQVATNVALLSLNVLRFIYAFVQQPFQRSFFGLPIELSKGHWSLVAYSPGHAFHVPQSSTGPLIPFELNASVIQHLQEKCHLNLIQEILSKPEDERNSLETVLVDSFQALGRAVVAPTTELFFLGCTIALERLRWMEKTGQPDKV